MAEGIAVAMMDLGVEADLGDTVDTPTPIAQAGIPGDISLADALMVCHAADHGHRGVAHSVTAR